MLAAIHHNVPCKAVRLVFSENGHLEADCSSCYPVPEFNGSSLEVVDSKERGGYRIYYRLTEPTEKWLADRVEMLEVESTCYCCGCNIWETREVITESATVEYPGVKIF